MNTDQIPLRPGNIYTVNRGRNNCLKSLDKRTSSTTNLLVRLEIHLSDVKQTKPCNADPVGLVITVMADLTRRVTLYFTSFSN